jgi:DNA topoisomerase-3
LFGRGVLKQQQHSTEWGFEVRDIITDGISKPRKGHDAGDHPPITPTKLANRSDLDGDAWKLYDYIARHFIATVRHFEVYAPWG